jgi:hypothetical protein
MALAGPADLVLKRSSGEIFFAVFADCFLPEAFFDWAEEMVINARAVASRLKISSAAKRPRVFLSRDLIGEIRRPMVFAGELLLFMGNKTLLWPSPDFRNFGSSCGA